MAKATMPTQRVVQLWTPDPALNATNVRRRPLTPCSHLLELQRRSAEEDHGSTVTRFRKPVPPPSHHNTKAHVASLLDICAQAILLHQHRQRTTRKSSSTAHHHNAPSSGRHRHWAEQKQEASLSVVATTGQFEMDLLPRELRAYLSEHWLCVVCQRPTRGQLKSHTHNSHHNKGRPDANYPGWCPACIQRLCYCQADGCQACNSTWLCLTCGKVCCSTSSHEHSFDHSMMESHMLAWKVGPRPFQQAAAYDAGDPGVWCFACSRYVGEAKLHLHLQTLGLTEPSAAAAADCDVSER